MGDFERTFGAGADIDQIIEYFNRAEGYGRSRYPVQSPRNQKKRRNLQERTFSSFQEASDWAKKNPGATITRTSDGHGYVGRFVFAFACDKKWRHLSITAIENVRHCADCNKDVFLCHTNAELEESARLNRCVAVDRQGRTERTEPSEDISDDLVLGEPPSWLSG